MRAIALLHGGNGGGGGGGGGGAGGGVVGGEGSGEGGGAGWPVLLVGTGRCSIWELGDTRGPTELLAAHFGELTGVAPHPWMPEVWASCGTDARVLLWRAGQPTPLQECTPTLTHSNPL